MLSRFRRWLRSVLLMQKLTVAQRMADTWLLDATIALKKLDDDYNRALQFREVLDESIAEQQVRLDDARKLIRQHETVVEALRSENKILGEVEVVNLTAACQLFLEQYRARTAVEVMRQVAASSKGE